MNEIRIWWNLVWDTLGMIPKSDLGFNRFNPSYWMHQYLVLKLKFGIEIRTWITLDLVAQFCWNFVSKTFGMIAKKWPINFKHIFLWRHQLVTFFLLFKTSLNIKRDFRSGWNKSWVGVRARSLKKLKKKLTINCGRLFGPPEYSTLRKKCLYSESFPCSDWIFNPNGGKCRLE